LFSGPERLCCAREGKIACRTDRLARRARRGQVGKEGQLGQAGPWQQETIDDGVVLGDYLPLQSTVSICPL